MTEKLKTILFFSREQFSDHDLEAFQKFGYSIIFSKGKARLIDELQTLKPLAFVLDEKYCADRSAPCEFLLQKLRHTLGRIPVFLINPAEINYLEFMKNELVYAVIKEKFSLPSFAMALNQYCELSKSQKNLDRMRFTVSVPCLVKKLGSSGVIYGHICDLSAKGMKVMLDVPPGTWVSGDEVRFSFTKGGVKGAHLEGEGCLRWTRKDEELPGSKQVRLGIEFGRLPVSTHNELLEILNKVRFAHAHNEPSRKQVS